MSPSPSSFPSSNGLAECAILGAQVDDLGQVGRHVCDQYPAGTPMFVGGQSMGALTSLHLMLRDESPWRGVVLGTATIDVEWNWVLRYRPSARLQAPS